MYLLCTSSECETTRHVMNAEVGLYSHYAQHSVLINTRVCLMLAAHSGKTGC